MLVNKRSGDYARGERNGRAKLSNHDADLIVQLHDSYCEDISRIDDEIARLKQERAAIKLRMRRSVIADMFGISTNHCTKIINGNCR